MTIRKASFWRIGIFLVFVAIVGSLAVSSPDALNRNKFLQSMMGPDLVAILIVFLTVTFASVANIHLSITRIAILAEDKIAASDSANRARGQLNSNAWMLFWAFGVALVALVVFGAVPAYPTLRSAMTAVCMSVVLLNGLVMHDIYSSLFMLVASEPQSEGQGSKPDNTHGSSPAA